MQKCNEGEAIGLGRSRILEFAALVMALSTDRTSNQIQSMYLKYSLTAMIRGYLFIKKEKVDINLAGECVENWS